MYTEIKNGKRHCISNANLAISKSYIKSVLQESGFYVVQEAGSSEFIMKGCDDHILIYVKFKDETESNLVILNSSERSSQLKLYWSNHISFTANGNRLLDEVRDLWEKI